MELKSVQLNRTSIKNSSNRTFMELKLIKYLTEN